MAPFTIQSGVKEMRVRGAHASSYPPIKIPNPIGRNVFFWLMVRLMDKDHEALTLAAKKGCLLEYSILITRHLGLKVQSPLLLR
jgi:hypothetical protein